MPKKVNQLLDAVPDSLIVVSHEGIILWTNSRVKDLLGFDDQELQGQDVEKLLPVEIRAEHRHMRDNYLSAPYPRPMARIPKIQARHKSGQSIPVDIELNQVDWEKGAAVMVAMRSRIERLESEQLQQTLLRENEERLRRSQEIAKIGSWDWDIVTNEVIWSDEIYRIFGWQRSHKKMAFRDISRAIHPDDRQELKSSIDDALHNNKRYSLEHRIITADGSERYVREVGEVYRDENGQPVRMLGTVQDVSRERESKLKLQLSQAIFENANEGMLSTDENFLIVAANPAVTALSGFSEEDFLGRPLSWLLPKSKSYFYLRPLFRALRDKGKWKGQTEFLRKDQPNCPALISLAFIRDQRGFNNQYAITLTDISKLKINEEQLENLAHFDQLTKLPNRTLFLSRLESQIKRAKLKPLTFSIHYLDLDGFKKINDSQGHTAGDELLFEVAEQLRAVVPESAFVARLGGDEFAIMQINCTPEDAERLAKLILRRLQLRKQFASFSLDISASIGIAHFPKDGKNSLELIKNADLAMYQAKDLGRNTFQHYRDSVGNLLNYKLQLGSDISQAIADNSFELYFQPRRIVQQPRVATAEALIRWFHPIRGAVSPVDFIPLAEDSGQILAIGDQVMSMACRFIQLWKLHYDSPITIAINLSARQLHDKNLLNKIRQTLDSTGVSAQQIEFEITESVAMQDGDMRSNLAIFESLKNMGASISIDDFGTGYSSLSYLKRLPVDTIKIDRSFIMSLPDSQDDLAIVNAIVSMAHNLNKKVVAEGVETFQQARVLTELGCDELQGYYLGRPQPAAQLLKSLRPINN